MVKTMNKAIRVSISALLSLVFICFSAFSTASLSSGKYEETAAYLQTLTPQVGSIGGEWLVIGLARAELLSEQDKQKYYETVERYVESVGSNKLHKRKSSDNSRVIIALASIGKNAKNVAGYDLTAPLSDMSYVTKQGINGAIWALIALDTYRYPIVPDESISDITTREKLIDEILSAQLPDGGWTLDGDVSDPDMTGMALQALSPYRFYDSDVTAAVNNGVERLRYFLTAENGNIVLSPESCAQIIVALCSLGIDPCSDERFVINNSTVLDRLEPFEVTSGFSHTLGGSYNQMATEQTFYALTAYNRFFAGKTSLYDMQDIGSSALYDYDSDGLQNINDVTYLQKYLAEYDITLSVSQKMLADFNLNRLVDITDITMFQIYLAQ